VDDQSAPPSRHRRRSDASSEPAEAPSPAPEPADSSDSSDAPEPGAVDLTGLSIAGITRRRVGWVSAGLVAVWIVILFARQVGDAQAASAQAAQLAADNTALADEVDALQQELDLIVRPQYVGLEARAHRFGNAREIPFALDPSVPAPVDGAPGSTSARLGAQKDRQTPLESWLSLLFGPAG
jgi:cell division protein FtsB